MHFLSDNFLLHNTIAEALYHEVAKDLPIFDYHCHLSPQLIAQNYQFNNLYDIWLKGDHYKWRAMRTNGVDERFCTGDASDYDKFLAYAETVPHTLGNPLYHWTHLELRRPFGITDRLLNLTTANSIWEDCNAQLKGPTFTTQGILQQMNVRMVGTTDDPIDDLQYHRQLQQSDYPVKVLPSFRPDRAFNIHAANFPDYIVRLGQAAQITIDSFETLCQALVQRIEHFAAHGAKISDHALDTVEYATASPNALNAILQRRLEGHIPDHTERAQFKTAILVFLGKEYAKRGWVQQYHIGALRNNNQRLFNQKGPDIGFDSINDGLIADSLSQLLNAQDQTDQLPKTILYCLNPRDNEVLATMTGNFQGNGIAGKIQFGSGWWFNDQKDGMQRQLTQLSQLSLLSRFVGMLTDSRSFLSFTRHEYFRRILCQMVGQWVVEGEVPHDRELLETLIRNVCYDNAVNYFQVEGIKV